MRRACLLVLLAGCTTVRPSAPDAPAARPAPVVDLPHGAIRQFGSALFHHDDVVTAVACSRDGRIIASASRDSVIHLWDAKKRLLLRTLRGDGPTITSLAFSPDGAALASTSARGAVTLWDTASGAPTELRGHLGRVAGAVYSPDGRTLASASYDMTIQLWDVASRASYCALIGHTSYVHKVAFSPDGRTLASGSYDHTLRLWSLPPEHEPLTIPTGGELLTAISYAPDGGAIAAGFADGSVRSWSPASGAPLFRQGGHAGWVRAIAFRADGTLASAGDDGLIRLWESRTGRAIGWLPGHSEAVTSLAFLPDGTLVSGGADKKVRLWDLAALRELAVGDGHEDSVTCAVFSRDGTSLFTGGRDGTVREWSIATGDQRRLIRHPSPVTALALAPDGKRLLAGGTMGVLRLTDLTDDAASIMLGGHGRDIIAVAYLADRIAAGGNEGATTFWPLDGRPPTQYLPSLGASAIAFAPDGETVAVAAGSIKIARSGAVAAELKGHTGRVSAVAFSGRLLASAGADRMIVLWDVERQSPRFAFTAHADEIRCIAFSHDGKLLASAGADRTVRIWETVTGLEVMRFEIAASVVSALAFSPDGRSLATGLANGSAILWSLAPDEALEPDDEIRAISGSDARRAYAAIWVLAARGDASVLRIEARLDLSARNGVRPLIDGLNADDIAERDRVSTELQKLGGEAEPELRDALRDAPTDEVRERVQTLLDRMSGPNPPPPGVSRVITVLERIGTRDAKELLMRLADRHPSAAVRLDARRALTQRP